jgi:ribosomal protein S14
MSEKTQQEKQAEYCANDVHDWKYLTGHDRRCKQCGKHHTYVEGTGWQNQPLP